MLLSTTSPQPEEAQKQSPDQFLAHEQFACSCKEGLTMSNVATSVTKRSYALTRLPDIIILPRWQRIRSCFTSTAALAKMHLPIALPANIELRCNCQVGWPTVADHWRIPTPPKEGLYRQARLAHGWRLEQDIGPELVLDATGRIRAVFYSHLSFPFMALQRRYQIMPYHSNEAGITYWSCIIIDTGVRPREVLWQSLDLAAPQRCQDCGASFVPPKIRPWMRLKHSLACRWLDSDEKRAGWRSPFACWN